MPKKWTGDVRDSKTKSEFRRILKQYLIKEYYYNVDYFYVPINIKLLCAIIFN